MKKVTCPICEGHGYCNRRFPCGYCNAKGHVYRVEDGDTCAQNSNDTYNDDEKWRQIIVDLDGVLARSVWPFDESQIPHFPVVDGAVEALRKVKEAGYRIIVWTARDKGLEQVTREWLDRNGIPYDELWLDKPPYTVMVDDRALNFDGSWVGLAERIVAYQTWMEANRDGIKSFATELALRQRDERVKIFNELQEAP